MTNQDKLNKKTAEINRKLVPKKYITLEKLKGGYRAKSGKRVVFSGLTYTQAHFVFEGIIEGIKLK